MARRILPHGVCEYLRHQIVTGRIEPGATIREEHVAGELQVSRTPVREALRKLADEGLLEYVPHRGARVLMPTPELVAEVLDIREALEGIAARQAATRIDPVLLAELRARFEILRLRVSCGDLSDVGDSIHDEILKASRHATLQRLMGIYRSQVTWFQRMVSNIPGRLTQAFGEHDMILCALESHDAEWAESATRAHIRNTRRALLHALQADEERTATPVRLRRRK